MGIDYKNLDAQTRKFMLKELKMDTDKRTLYISPRLNSMGQSIWAELLKEAIVGHSDDWLATQLNVRGYMKSHEERRLPSGKITVAKVPVNAPEMLAEGEFNRFYARGLCARAIAEGISEVVVCRGKQVRQPRPESQAMIGTRIIPTDLLDDLRRSQGVEPALGIPPGPNSGLTICLP
ncbi:MAG TPA: hypothetical protein PLG49_09160 [Defluviitaleaceae bacterium]|nr:hypothetical protein [Defluviitaleaceae bacterium]